MLKSVEIHNFLGHKDTYIEFSPYVTVIDGETNSGKSSVLKAIDSVLRNKYSNPEPVSFWAKKDDKILDISYVTIEIDDMKVTRFKDKTKNGYILNDDWDHPYTGLNKSLPEGLVEKFNISDVNFLNQFDNHFLVRDSTGQLTKKINELINLTEISEATSYLRSRKLQCKKDIEKLNKEIKVLDTDINKYSFIDKMSTKLGELEFLIEQEEKLNTSLVNLDKYKEVLTQYNNILAQESKLKHKVELLDNLEQLDLSIFNITQNIIKIEQARNNIIVYDKDIKEHDYINNQHELINKLILYSDKIGDIDTKLDKLNKYREILVKSNKIDNQVIKYRKQLELIAQLYNYNNHNIEIDSQIKKIEDYGNLMYEYNIYKENTEITIQQLKDQLNNEFQDLCPVCGGEYHVD